MRDIDLSDNIIAFYAMSNWHIEDLKLWQPELEPKMHFLHPEDAAVWDPIGDPLHVYAQTRDQIQTLVHDRMRSLFLSPET